MKSFFIVTTLATSLIMAIPTFSFYNSIAKIEHHHHDNYFCISSNSQQSRSSIPLQCRLSMTPSITSTEEDDRIERFSRLCSIGIDYGLSRTGLAITTGGYRPRPLTILSDLQTTELITTIVNYVISERATNIVLGLPLNKNGTDSHQSFITREFGQSLLQEVRSRCGLGINISLWDERYTSKEAVSRIQAEAMARKERIPSKSDLNTELDADAACIILEDYYKELGVDAEVILIEDEIEKECLEMYKQNIEREELIRQQRMEERERGRDARRLMMERDMAMELARKKENGEEYGAAGGGTKKKKKKKKKKR